MAIYEWVLATPVFRDFERQHLVEVEVEEPVVKGDGLPGIQKIKRRQIETVQVEQQANIARLVAIHNDTQNHRLFVRLFFGRLENGKFVTPALDDGVVFGGPTYTDHEFHTNPTALEEQTLLSKVANVMKWDGTMRPVAP
jgi:hypothetical protein